MKTTKANKAMEMRRLYFKEGKTIAQIAKIVRSPYQYVRSVIRAELADQIRSQENGTAKA